MTFTLDSSSDAHRYKLILSPTTRRTESFHQVATDQQVPDGVLLSPAALDPGLNWPASRPVDLPVASPGFTPEEAARVRQHSPGNASWSTIATQSGLQGEALDVSSGLQFRLLAPEGVLPRALLLERTSQGVAARTLEGSELPAREADGELQVEVAPHLQAVLHETDYSLSLRGPHLEERLYADNRREIVADRVAEGTYRELGFPTPRSADHRYELHQGRDGNWSGEYVWHVAATPGRPELTWHLTERVEPQEDGRLIMTPDPGWRSRWRDHWRNPQASKPDGFQPPADLVELTPFSAPSTDS